MSFIQRINSKKPLVLDGALGTLLPQESQSHALWSTHTVVTLPQAILDIHKSYISHGAELIQTSTYQTSKDSLLKYFPQLEYSECIQKSIDLASCAKEESDHRDQVFIAGSVGPYGASLANGAEYTGDYGKDTTSEDIRGFHQERLDILCQDSRVDVIALETMPNESELRVLIEMMNGVAKPYYLSLSVKEETLADGTPLETIVEILKLSNDNCIAVGVNCLAIDSSLKWLTKLEPLGKGLVVYPNSGEVYVDRKWVLDPTKEILSWDDYVKELAKLGNVKIVGGCCRTTPQSIQEIKQAVDRYYPYA